MILLQKKQKLQESPSHYFEISTSSPSKIFPIPIIYRKIQNDKKLRTRLAISGYKNFSKLSACGEDTALTLENLIKAQNMKYIRRFEFDPYLCEKSHMKPFGKAIKKFKDIKDLNLVIRRLDYTNESNILGPYMARLGRLKKFRLELAKIEKLEDEGFMRLAWMFGKLYSMEESRQTFVGMDHISQMANMHFAIYGQKLKGCKKITKTVQRGSLGVKNDMKNVDLEERLSQTLRCRGSIQDLELDISIPRGWLSMSTDVDESATHNLKMIFIHASLERLYLRFSGNPVTLETIQRVTEKFDSLNNIRTFGLEFLNSRMSETEVIIFAQALPQLKSLEKLSFKVIQYPSVSEGCIYYLMSSISKLPHLKQFDIYFRRLASDEMVPELIRRIKALGNIECEHSKQSLYFYRR